MYTGKSSPSSFPWAPQRTRLAALGIAAALSLTTLTACGGSSGSSSGPVQMWTFKQSHVSALRAAAKDFKAKTGIEVKIEAYTPDDAYGTKVQSAAKTGNLPDVLEVHSDGEEFAFGSVGVAADLKGQIPDSWSSRYAPAVRQSGTVNDLRYKESLPATSKSHGVKKGARYSVPFTIGTFGIVYASKSKLAAAGITKPPATWEQFIADLKATHAKDPRTGGLSAGLKVPSVGLNWIGQPLAFAQLGKDSFRALYGKDKAADWASPNGRKVLSAYNQLTPYWMPGAQTLTIDDADQSFAQGKSAFDVGGTFTLAFLEQSGMKADDIMAFGLPAPKNAASKLTLGPIALTSLSLTATATSGKQDKAKQWMQYLSERDVAAKFAKNASDLPATELGSDAAKILGPNLTTLMKVFKGTPQTTYDPSDTSYRPPTFDMDEAGAIVIDMSPLRQKSVDRASQDLRKLTDAYWAESR
jgi:ABC-type glycerol-3-phosphate transport system substrate-binding protein